MPYTISSSEQTKKSGSEGETKALLYLMNFRSDSDEIQYFIVDFFNDLTGMDRYSSKLWDVQSKAGKNHSPKTIGRELVTLFKNYISEFTFSYYILFIGGVSASLRIDDTKTTFSIENVTCAAKKKLIEGLKEEANSKNYIGNQFVTDQHITDFLDHVLFVIDDKDASDYVRAIIKDHPNIIPENHVLTAIFNEIRDNQSSKKNSHVEGIVIQTTDEALNYCRHLTSSEIRLLVLQRIINRNPVEKSIPLSFIPIYSTWVPERQKEMIDECKQALCRALFNKSAANQFWALFEEIYNLIVSNPTYTVQQIFLALNKDIRDAAPDFDTISLKYFIAVIKDGIQDDN